MSKGAFNTWIKELCALVFVQTIQAFILAIVLSIILTFLFPELNEQGIATVTSQDQVSALGVLCIILLTSLTKMEQITKKIFGLESGVLQNKPPHGLAATMLALKAVGRVFNNVPKMVGGIGSATLGAGLDKKKAQSAMLAKLQRRGLDKNGNPVGVAEPQVNATASDDTSTLPDSSEYYKKAKEAKKAGDMDGYRTNMGIAAGMNKVKKAMEKNITSSAVPSPSYTDKDKDNYLKIMEQYDDAISKAKEKRRQGLENLASGAAETLGAGIGGMTGLSIGAISGLATGDFDQIPKAAAYGIGVGDAAGENLTKAVSAAASGIKSRAKVNSNLDKQLAQMERNLKINNEHRSSQAKRVKNITQKIEKDIGLQ